MTKTLKNKRIPWNTTLLVIILLLGLLLRIIYLGERWDSPDFTHPGLDSAYHIYWARGMATGDWSAFEGREDPMIYRYPYYRPPGYAYFLSIIYFISGMGPLWPRLVQFGLGLGSILLAFYLARRLFDKITGLIAAFLASFYWIFIYYECELAGVSWAIFLSLLSVLLLIRSASRRSMTNFFFTGLVLGVLAIFRPNALILYPVSVFWIFLVSRHRIDKPQILLPAASLLLGIVIAILPVTIRNYVVAGEFVPIATNAGISLGVANNDFSDGTTHFIPGIGNIGTPYDWPRIVRGLSHDLGQHLTHGEASNYLSRQAIGFAWRNPGRFLYLLGRKTLLFWGPIEVRNLKEVHYARIHSPLLRFLPGNFTLILTLALLGVISILTLPRQINRNLDPYLIILFIGGYFISMVPFAAAARYRVPVIPFLIVLGAFGIRRFLGLLLERKWGRGATLASSGVVLYIILSINFSGVSPAPEKWHYDRGLARLESGEYQGSVREFSRALEYKPDYGAAYTNRGVALSKSGDPAAAISSYRRALALEPDSPRPLKNLADALLDQGETAEALILYQRALNLAPGYSGIACDLARALSSDGREEEAIVCYQAILRSDPESIRAHLGLGNLLLARNQSNAARGHYQEALKINPGSSNARYNLGNLLIEEGLTEEGMACYREVIRRDPEHIDARNNLGVQLAIGGNGEEATVYLLEAIRIAPRDPAAYFNLAVILTGTGKNSEAIPYLEKVLELSPKFEPAHRALAAIKGKISKQ